MGNCYRAFCLFIGVGIAVNFGCRRVEKEIRPRAVKADRTFLPYHVVSFKLGDNWFVPGAEAWFPPGKTLRFRGVCTFEDSDHSDPSLIRVGLIVPLEESRRFARGTECQVGTGAVETLDVYQNRVDFSGTLALPARDKAIGAMTSGYELLVTDAANHVVISWGIRIKEVDSK